MGTRVPCLAHINVLGAMWKRGLASINGWLQFYGRICYDCDKINNKYNLFFASANVTYYKSLLLYITLTQN